MEATDSAAAAPSSRSAFSAPLRIFSAPASVLADVKAGLPWWPGLALLVVLTAGLVLLMYPMLRELMTLDVSSGQMKGVALDASGDLPAPILWSLIVTPLVQLPLRVLTWAFFCWLALVITFGSSPFRRLFTLAVYASSIAMAHQIINTLYLRFSGLELSSMKDLQHGSLELSLGALVQGDNFLANFLGQVGIFELWELWIFLGGAALLLGRKRSTVIPPIVVIFLLKLVLVASVATFMASFSG